VHVSAELRYDADPDAVITMLADPDFQARKCQGTGAVEWDVDVVEHGHGGVTVTTVRVLPTDSVSDVVRAFVGPRLTVRQVDDWEAALADGSRTGRISVTIEGAPVKLTGSQEMAVDGGGTVQYIEGDLRASVPLLGGRIEKAAEPAIQAAIRVEQREGLAWLAEG
jgi:hypothetical protein